MATRQPLLVLFVLGLALLLAMLMSLDTGAMRLPASPWLLLGRAAELPAGDMATARYVLLELRLPRIIAALVVGAGLAVAGAGIQSLFRNPLADPGLIGVASGAAFGAVLMIVGASWLGGQWLQAWSHWLLPLAAFAGGLLATLLVYLIAWQNGRTSTALLLLAGVAINALAGAGTGVLTFLADDYQLRDMTFWSMGSLAKVSWAQLAIITPLTALACLLLTASARGLNALLMGEEVAGHIGFPVVLLRHMVILLATLVIGAAVAVAGVIGFVGLVVPHLGRLLVGSDHRWLLPVCALLGALLLLLADSLARVLAAPAELPIGLLMSLLGAPFFIVLLKRQQRGAGHGLAG